MKKIDKIIEAFRNYRNLKEEGMITSVDGPTNKTGPAIVNFDPLLGKKKKDGTVDFRRIKPNYRKWVKDK